MPKEDKWNISVFNSSPVFKELQPFTRHFDSFKDWPTVEEYAALFKQHKLDIMPVPQAASFENFEDLYEPRVFLRKELQTRSQNWHDFFNAMIWLKFPETKKTLNKLHYSQASQRPKGSNRSKLENRITLFDECGAIIISNSPELLAMVKQHQWHELFIEHKNQFKDNFRCIIFGHAIFEKLLNPYIGITCQCILLEDRELLESVKTHETESLDLKLADLWENMISENLEKFDPLPLLGIPGYWPEQNIDFYNNKIYFR